MPPTTNNCCCFCFNAKTGVKLIGTLTWLNFLGSLLACVWLYIGFDDGQWKYYLASIFTYLIVVCVYSSLNKYEGSIQDFRKRTRFWRNYLIWIVICHSIVSIWNNIPWYEAIYYLVKKDEHHV